MRGDARTRQYHVRLQHSLFSTGTILMAGVAAPRVGGASCSAGDNGLNEDLYPVQSLPTVLGDRFIQVTSVEKKPASPTLNANPSQHRTALSGDPR